MVSGWLRRPQQMGKRGQMGKRPGQVRFSRLPSRISCNRSRSSLTVARPQSGREFGSAAADVIIGLIPILAPGSSAGRFIVLRIP